MGMVEKGEMVGNAGTESLELLKVLRAASELSGQWVLLVRLQIQNRQNLPSLIKEKSS
jgi:hypothetical protein